ncbi:MAG TPA: DUF3291 domain-containing protein [Steroidobacteraceae bacterium]|jgi:hypothetical protein
MVISITRLRIRAWRFMPGFLVLAIRSAWQARQAPDNLCVSLLVDADRTYWTRTGWRTETALRAYMLAGPHRVAMTRLADWCDEAATVCWLQDEGPLPSWAETRQRMQREGRPSRLKHPSSAHEGFRIAEQKRPGPFSQVHLT